MPLQGAQSTDSLVNSPNILDDLANAPLKFKTILIANRGEISIRIARSAHELGLKTIAIYSYEDRYSMHRYKADEAWQIGEEGQYTPVGAYLQIDEIIRIAKQRNADVIHAGYGFLSENAEFARKVREAGIAFVGPPTALIKALGDKVAARHLVADVCKVQCVPGSNGPVQSVQEVKQFVDKYGLPIIIKAAMGGGGRGMRMVKTEADYKDIDAIFSRCQSEAKSAFGDGTVFVEKLIQKAKHIEVQILADSYNAIEGQNINDSVNSQLKYRSEIVKQGDTFDHVMHLFERDCSVQRRHQKVVEIAPSPPGTLHPTLRDKILSDAVKIARISGYVNAGTVEFLAENCDQPYSEDLKSSGGHCYFIEINPRIQVEHTVTEEILGVDLIAAQIRIAAGQELKEIGFKQNMLKPRGYAIQCRITTEDALNSFAPDAGKLQVYRSAGGNGVRLDGFAHAGFVISPYYDSLLVKCITYASEFDIARRKMLRALMEFRVRGVKTNIGFLYALLQSEIFESGHVYTTHLDECLPSYFEKVKRIMFGSGKNRAQKLLNYLADVAVNGSQIKGQSGEPGLRDHDPLLPKLPADIPIQYLHEPMRPEDGGWRYVFLTEGPEAFAKAVRKHPTPLIMDTTMRDAHQSLLATRLRTIDMLKIAPLTSHLLKHAFSLECWGGATFDVSLQFLHECPFDRLRRLRKAIPNIPFQMLLRGANAVGYTSYPDNVIYDFCKKAKDAGVDIFRVFDSLNYVENLELGIKAVKAAGGICEGTICYTGDVFEATKVNGRYDLPYYLALVEKLVKYGIHILGIKDMAGLLTPKSAKLLIGSIRAQYPDLVIHVHTHDTASVGVSTMIACVESGADVIDAAIDALSGQTSQPCAGTLIYALQNTEYDLGVKYEHIQILNEYWEQIRLLYQCFDPKVGNPSSEVLTHQMPGGQYTNLLFQATSMGLGERWTQVKKAYVEANRICGDIVKVTPSSKVVGDLAQFMVSNKLTEQDVYERAGELDFPRSVIEYFQGYLGQPPYGFNEELRSKILRGREKIEGRPGASLKPFDFDALRKDLYSQYGPISEEDLSSSVQYPAVFKEFMEFKTKFGDVSVLPTRFFLSAMKINEECTVDIEDGKTLIIKLLAVGQSSKDGEREVFFSLNGQTRAITVKDKASASEVKTRPKANPANKNEVAASMSGSVVEIRVKEGQAVKVGDPLFVMSAMKMEATVSAPLAGTVKEIHVQNNDSLSVGDLLCKIE
ncbi:hypothetical protein MP228_010209 [Amoeboaphelidium protococcarum]|nr:hypothetical protein MP228_010209 [Amoeboaphelidium protococcarum]